MICVYAPDCTDFSTNGLGPVSPQSATVTETLNGEYELTLVHPLDEAGKWQRLTEGRILRAPVPAAMTPQVELIRQPSTGTEIYRVSTNRDPLRLRSGTGTKYRILAKYKKGTEVIALAKTTSSWYEVSCPDGKHGYMASQYLTYVRSESVPGKAVGEVIEPRQLRDQPFRIYRVVPELDKVTVYARHVFYDLLDNMIKSYKPSSTTVGASVVQEIAAKCQSEHDFTFYSDLDTTANEVEWENINPVEALLGEGGLVEKYKSELARDWFDVFLVRRVGSDKDVQIREGKNLLGISYDVDLTDVTTRIMPTGEDKDGNLLYLPELYIDSPNIENYPHAKWMHLAVSEAKEVTKGDNKKSKSQCYTEMRTAAQAELDAGCDLPTVTLKVDFINCAETEEYRQYGFLQNIFLGDSVRVIARRIGVEVSMRMTQYTYDCLTRRYTAMTLGTVADTIEGNMISARQLAIGSITGAKLAPNSVGSGQLQSGSVGSLQIQNAAIASAHIQDAAISSAQIQSASISSAHIQNAAIGSAQIQDAAIGSAHIQDAAIGSAQIQDASIVRAHIAEALIDALNVNALTAVTARIKDLVAGSITADELYVSIAMIAAAQLTTANIISANIDWAQIDELSARIAALSKAQITTAHISEAQIEWASITALTAAVASIARANIASADIDFAHIKDLATDTAIITQGVSGQLYISRLAVTEANMVNLSVGELLIKGSDGGFYALGVDADGRITTTLKQVSNGDVKDLSINAEEKLIEGTVTAATLNADDIFASNAVIRKLIAANLEVDTLWGREAWMSKINGLGGTLDLSANESIRLIVSSANAEKSTIFRQEDAPTGASYGDLWVQPSTGQTRQYCASVPGAPVFALSDDGQLAYAYADGDTVYPLQINEEGYLEIDSAAPFDLNPDNAAGAWLLVVDAGKIDSRLASTESAIVQTADQIAMTVKRVEAAQSTADGAQSAADANASDISALAARMTTAESSITQTADQIALTVKRVETAQTTADGAQAAADANASDISALATRLTTAESSIVQTADQIAQTVKRVDTVQTAVSTAQSAASAAQSAADANASNISALTTRVTASEAAIVQNASDISLRATKAELSALDTRVQSAEVAVRPDSITAVVKQKVAFGGTNLILNSAFRGMTGAGIYSFSGDAAVFSSSATGVTSSVSFPLALSGDVAQARGREITFSMDCRVDSAISYGATSPWVGAQISLYLPSENMYLQWYGGNTFPTAVTGKWVRYATTFSIPDAEISGGQIAFYFRDAAGKVRFRHPKLEIGGVATEWSPSPEDPGQALNTYSGVRIDQDEIQLVSAKTTIAVPGGNGEDDVARFDAEGVHARIVEADTIYSPSVVATQSAETFAPANAGALAAIGENLRNVCLTGDVTVNMPALTGGTLNLTGVSGGHTLKFSGGTLNGANILGCSARIEFENVTFATSGAAVTANDSDMVLLNRCTLNAGTGVLADEGSRVRLYSCGGVCDVAANSRSFSEVTFNGTAPGTDMPYGVAQTALGGQIYAGARLTAKPSSTPEPDKPTVQTVTLTPTLTRTYDGSWRDGYCLWQGRYGTRNLNRGCMWFNTSDFAGKTVLSASLSLKRLSGAGSGGAVAVKICGTTATGASGAPAVGSQYASVSIGQNERRSVDVTAAAQALASGTIKGLMLYDSSTTNMSSSNNYTACYAKLYGYDSGDRPVLTVTYQ